MKYQNNNENKKLIGYTTGVFDMFHIGHLNILRKAKMNCDYLIVGVTTDELCETEKSKASIIPFMERMEIVQSIKFVDEVVPQTNMDKFDAWEKLKFDIIFVGSDWQGSERWNKLDKQFSAVGVKIAYLPYTKHTSSTKLRIALGI